MGKKSNRSPQRKSTAAKIRKSKQQPRIAVDEAISRSLICQEMVAATPDRMSLVDTNYVYREVNAAYLADCQRTRDEIVGHHVAEIFGKEKFEKSIKPHFDTCLSGSQVRYQDWFELPTGRRFVDVIYNPFHGKDGRVAGVIVTTRDFTEAQCAREALQETGDRLNLLASNIEDVVWILDWKAEKFLYVNAAYERIWRQPLQDLYADSKNWLMAVHPDDRSRVKSAFAALGRLDRFLEEYRIVRPDGEIRWIRDRGAAVREGAGKTRRIVGIAQDVTELKRFENALSSERRRLSAFLNNSLVFGWMKDVDGRLVYMSENCEKRYGVRFEDWKGKNDFELWPREIAESFQRNDRVVLNGGKPIEIVEKTPHPEGGDSWFLNNKFPFQDEEGKRYVGGLGVDISALKQAQDALEIEQRRLGAFLNNSLIIAWMKDEDGRYVYWSQNCEKHFQLHSDGWQGKTDFDLWPRDIADELRRNDLVVLNGGRPIETIEKVPNPDGSISWYLNNKFPFRDEDGRQYVGGLGVDITKSRWAEEERQKFVLLADQSHEFIGMCDCKFTPLYLNAAGLRLVGLDDLDAACRVQVPDYFFPEDQSLIMNEFFPRVQREGRAEIEIRFRHFKTGQPIWMLYNVFNIRDANGTVVGWATVSRDITERKQAEETRRRLEEKDFHTQKLEAIGKLAAGMAHDINTLLMVILGNAQLVQSQIKRKKNMNTAIMTEQMGAIVDAVDRGKAFLDKLLTFGRVRSSILRPIDLSAVVADTLRMVKSIIGQDIQIQRRLAGDLMRCAGDATQLEQVVMNLIRNAIDAMPDGGTLTVQTENVVSEIDPTATSDGAGKGTYVVLTVRDTGIGMDRQTQEHLFEPFYSTKPVDKGVGLGLSIVYAIVKQAGGYVTVDSEVGKGTTFRVYLPASDSSRVSSNGATPISS